MQAKRAWLTAAVVAALALSGCGGGGENSADDQQAPDRATGQAIKIGWLTDTSGVVRNAYFPEAEGARLYFQTLNDSGGVHDRPVEVVVRDIAVNPQLAVTEMTRLAQDLEIVMVAGGTLEGLMPALFDIVRSEGLAYMTGHSARPDMLPPSPDPWLFTAGNVFEAMSDARTKVWPEMFAEQYPDGGTAACYLHEAPAKTAVCNRWLDEMAELTDWNSSVIVSAPISSADVGPFLGPLLDANPDAVLNISEPHVLPVSTYLRNNGYDGALVFSMTSVPETDIEQVAAQTGGKNIWALSDVVSVHEDTPAVQRVLDAAEKYGTEIEPNSATIRGWVMGMIIADSLERCGDPCSRDDFRAALETVDLDTEGLMGGNFTFSSSDHTGPRYWTGYRWDSSGKLVRAFDDWVEFKPTDLLAPVG